MVTANASNVERFRGLVARWFGLSFDDSKLGLLAEVLRERLLKTGMPAGEYLSRADTPEMWRSEVYALAEGVTVTETYFFRNIEQFQAFRDVVLTARLRESASQPSLRILSAGCASGEEAYSLAILMREHLESTGLGNVRIQGVDVNPAMLERARRGRYSAWSLRETPMEIQRRWFRTEGREFVLNEGVRSMVTLEHGNLTEPNPSLWQPDAFHAVFCRNVIMYLTPEHARALVGRIAGSLVPGGILFLGHAENLRGLSHDFRLRHTHGTFYYERTSVARGLPLHSNDKEGTLAPYSGAASMATLVSAADSWVDAICGATERIRALTANPAARDSPHDVRQHIARESGVGLDVGQALQLLRGERFVEALALIGDLPAEFALDADVLLLRAVLLMHSGRLKEAAETCRELLEVDEMNSGAHYLLALGYEAAGDRSRAVEQDQIAVYLDPSFAMARLHLGLLTRQSGDHEAAGREFRQAAALLQREDPARLLLFGSGFGREALVALCRAELAGCGELT